LTLSRTRDCACDSVTLGLRGREGAGRFYFMVVDPNAEPALILRPSEAVWSTRRKTPEAAGGGREGAHRKKLTGWEEIACPPERWAWHPEAHFARRNDSGTKCGTVKERTHDTAAARQRRAAVALRERLTRRSGWSRIRGEFRAESDERHERSEASGGGKGRDGAAARRHGGSRGTRGR